MPSMGYEVPKSGVWLGIQETPALHAEENDKVDHMTGWGND